jgi:hypothetical protein
LDDSRFDRLSKQLADGGSRRGLLRAITGVSLVGAGALLVAEDGEARARRGKGVQSEHYRKRKSTFCMNGETFRALRRKKASLLAQGATLGKCTEPVCTPDCAGKECGPDGCGGTCGAGCTGFTCCASDGTCSDGTTNEACGTAGNICQVCVAPQECIAFGCIEP